MQTIHSLHHFKWALILGSLGLPLLAQADRPATVRATLRTKPSFTLVELLLLISIIAMPLRAAQPQAGSVDLSFNAGELRGFHVPGTGFYTVVDDIALLSDGRIYIGGHLGWVQGVPRDAIARLLSNGLLDATFQEHGSEFSLGRDVHRLFLQSDGKLVTGARRFNPDGTGDSSLTNRPNIIAVLPGGKFLAIANGLLLVRLFSDGTRDPSFSWPANLGADEFPVLVEPDGKILLKGYFESAGVYRLVRLLPDGAFDPSFKTVTFEPPADGRQFLLRALARQSDGRYLLAGNLYKINQQRVGIVVRLNTDGTFDPSFAVAADFFLQGEPNEPDDLIYNLAVQPDGKILVGGQLQGGLVRLNCDGSVDSSFDVGTGAQSRDVSPANGTFVKRIVLQPDGRILVSGEFNEFGGVPRSYLVRLHGDSPLLRLGSPQRLSGGRVEVAVEDFTGRTTVVEAATELSPPNWQPIWTNTIPGGSFTAVDSGGSELPRRFYRAVTR